MQALSIGGKVFLPVTEKIGGKGDVNYINTDQVDHLDFFHNTLGVWKKDPESGFGVLAGYLDCQPKDIKKIDLNA